MSTQGKLPGPPCRPALYGLQLRLNSVGKESRIPHPKLEAVSSAFVPYVTLWNSG